MLGGGGAQDYQSKAAREYNNYLKEDVKVSNPMSKQQPQLGGKSLLPSSQ
jgi:hypothetical protein